MSAASTDGSGLRGWAVRLTGPLLFLLSLGGAGAIGFFAVEALDDGGEQTEDSGDEPTLLANYVIPSGEPNEGASGAIFGPDEVRDDLPVSHGSGAGSSSAGSPGGGTGNSGDEPAGSGETELDEDVSPTERVGTPEGEDDDSTITPAEDDATPDGDGGSDEGAAPTGDLLADIDLRPSGVEILDDICALDLADPGCPDGIPGTVIGGDESAEGDDDVGSTTEALTAGDLTVRALLSADESDPDYTDRAEGRCAPADAASLSLLVEATQPLYLQVNYWPVRYLPGGETEATAAASTVYGWADYEQDGDPFRFYGCVRLEIGTGIAFEVQIRASDVDGNTIWTPIYDFCRECPIFVGDLSLEDATAFTIEPHADWAAATVENPPGNGSLEFAYRLPGTERWASTLQGGLAEGEVVRLLTGHRLLPATEYEYRLTYNASEPDATFVSETGRFTTLRRDVVLSMSRFRVASGSDDELAQISFELCGTIPGRDLRTEDASDCSGGTRESFLGGLRVEGRETVRGGLSPASLLLIEEGDVVTGEFDPPDVRLSATPATGFTILVWTTNAKDECAFFNECHWIASFTVPAWFPARDSCGEENTFQLRTSATARGVETGYQYFRNTVGGPKLVPIDIAVCVIEVP